MTQMLAGAGDFHHGVVTEKTFTLALANLETLFAAIIPSERFDEGLLLLARDLGWKTPYYLRRKVGRHPSNATQPDSEALRAIKEQNRYDRQLYDRCVARFARRADTDPDLPDQLLRFRKTNAALGKAVFLVREFKSRYL